MKHRMWRPMRWTALAVLVACGAVIGAESPDPQSPLLPAYTTPEWLAQKYVGEAEWQKLDALIDGLVASSERHEDGRYRLYLVTTAVSDWLDAWDEEQDRLFQQRFDEYERDIPGSAFAPILRAMQLRTTAWRARGSGYASTVTPEGWKLFKQRISKAWEILQQSKARSSRVPTWYEQSIITGMDAGVPDAQVTALFNEGIRRFPGFHPLYFTYIRQFTPKWGGDYETARDFIEAQVAAKTNPEGEILYARLYWLLDQYSGHDPDFLADSLLNWPRMRNGFELLMKQYPQSKWNQANFAAFACRSGDANTYLKWRDRLPAGEFRRAAPEGLSLEVCNARFLKGA